MLTHGVVLEVKDRVAKVEVKGRPACKKCGACRMGKDDKIITEVGNNVGAHPGDTVQIKINTPSLLKAAFVIYIVPVIGLMLSVIIGEKITSSQTLIAVLGMVGFCFFFTIVYLLNKWYDRKIKEHGKLKCQISAIISSS